MTIDLSPWLAPWRSRFPSPPPPSPSGIVIGYEGNGEPIYWPLPSSEHSSSVVCWGASGCGKTALIAHALVKEWIALRRQNTDPPSLLVVDPKGDLATYLIQAVAAIAPELLTTTAILDPFGQHAFAFNLAHLPRSSDTPIDIRALQLAELVSAVSATGTQAHVFAGARQLDVLQHCLLGALTAEHSAASPLWALDALTTNNLQGLAAVSSSARAREFLTTVKLSDELRISTASRLRSALAASDQLEKISAASGCISWSDLLGPGRMTICDVGRPTAGLTSLQSFYSSLLTKLAVEHLLERPSPWKGHHTRIVIDEAHLVGSILAQRAEIILTTGRSRGCSATVISQGTTLLHAISDTIVRVLLTNAPLRLIGRLAAPDAELLARELAPTNSDESVATMRQKFIARTTNLADRQFFALLPNSRRGFRSADVDLPGWQRAAVERHAEIEAARRRYALPATSTPRVRLSEVSPPSPRPSKRGSRSAVIQETEEVAPPRVPLALPMAEPSPAKPRSRWG